MCMVQHHKKSLSLVPRLKKQNQRSLIFCLISYFFQRAQTLMKFVRGFQVAGKESLIFGTFGQKKHLQLQMPEA